MFLFMSMFFLSSVHAKKPPERFPKQFIRLLQKGGWTPTPTNSGRYQIGDVFDFSTNKKILTGEKCFEQLPTPQPMSDINITNMLKGGLTVPFGIIKGKVRGKRYKKSTFANTIVSELDEMDLDSGFNAKCVAFLKKKMNRSGSSNFQLIRAIIQSEVKEQECSGKEVDFGFQKISAGAEAYEQCGQDSKVQVTIAYQLIPLHEIEVLQGVTPAKTSQPTAPAVKQPEKPKQSYAYVVELDKSYTKSAGYQQFLRVQKSAASFYKMDIAGPKGKCNSSCSNKYVSRAVKAKSQSLSVHEKALSQLFSSLQRTDPAAAVACLSEVGRLYENYASTVENSWVPAYLSEGAQSIYKMQLSDRAYPMREKALKSYQQVLKMVNQSNVKTTEGKWAIQRLQSLQPSSYPLLSPQLLPQRGIWPSSRNPVPSHLQVGFQDIEYGLLNQAFSLFRNIDTAEAKLGLALAYYANNKLQESKKILGEISFKHPDGCLFYASTLRDLKAGYKQLNFCAEKFSSTANYARALPKVQQQLRDRFAQKSRDKLKREDALRLKKRQEANFAELESKLKEARSLSKKLRKCKSNTMPEVEVYLEQLDLLVRDRDIESASDAMPFADEALSMLAEIKKRCR